MKPFLVGTLAAVGLATCACSGRHRTAAQPVNTVTVTARPSASTPTAVAHAALSARFAGRAACLTRYLNGSVGAVPRATAGGLEIVIVFKNLDNVPCTLYGFPGVAQAAGTPVTDIGQPSTENPSTRASW